MATRGAPAGASEYMPAENGGGRRWTTPRRVALVLACWVAGVCSLELARTWRVPFLAGAAHLIDQVVFDRHRWLVLAALLGSYGWANARLLAGRHWSLRGPAAFLAIVLEAALTIVVAFFAIQLVTGRRFMAGP